MEVAIRYPLGSFLYLHFGEYEIGPVIGFPDSEEDKHYMFGLDFGIGFCSGVSTLFPSVTFSMESTLNSFCESLWLFSMLDISDSITCSSSTFLELQEF